MVFAGFFYFDTGSVLEQDLRNVFFSNTWTAVKENWLVGTGLGSFVLIYPMYEAREEIISVYANHAHSDYLELLLEIGIIALPLFAFFLLQIVKNMFISKLAEAAALSIFAVLIHTVLDYPLRTMAIAIIFACLSAIILSERPTIRPMESRHEY